MLKSGVQLLMDTQEILFQNTLIDTFTPATFATSTNDIAIITISDNPPKACKRPVRITPDLKFVPLKITMPGPVPYQSSKTIPWNYGGEIFYHGIKQIEAVQENSEEENHDIGNIAGTSKITRSGQIFSPEIAPSLAVFGPLKASVPVGPSVQGPMIEELDTPEERPSADTTDKGKGILEVPVRTKAHVMVIPETTDRKSVV